MKLRSFDWERIEIGLITAFHLVAGITIGLAPESQVVTTGTMPVFRVIPELLTVQETRVLWAVLYVLAGLLALRLLFTFTLLRQATTWLVVAFIGFTWAGTFGLAVLNGQGSAIGFVVWALLLLWWATVAVRIALGGTGDKCGNS